MYQQQFTEIYNRLSRYAYYKAGRYFRDAVLRQDAADEAVNDAVDAWINGQLYDEELAKRTIQSSLRQASRKRDVEPVNIEGDEFNNMHGYRLV